MRIIHDALDTRACGYNIINKVWPRETFLKQRHLIPGPFFLLDCKEFVVTVLHSELTINGFHSVFVGLNHSEYDLMLLEVLW